jgi:hypothetical protein
MAASRMILLAYLGSAPPPTELVKAGVLEGALTDQGLLHAGIVLWTRGAPWKRSPLHGATPGLSPGTSVSRV